MSYYNAGTVSVTNGDAHVLATGTVFLSQAAPGDLFVAKGLTGTIKQILSSTELLLEDTWQGTTASDISYQVLHVSDYWQSNVTINEQLTSIIQSIEAGIGFKPDATGTLSERSNFDTAAKDFIFMRTDVDPFVIYVKKSATAGDWSSGASFQGPAGPDGPQGASGAVGPANVLTIGSVLGGDTAAATLTGSSPAQVLNLTLPAGAAGLDGIDGWTPIIAIVSDSARRVMQIADWTGGEGSKPATGQYVGATGLTSTLADAVDMRGTVGATGPANTLTIGTVTTGAAGSSAAASLSGSVPDQVLALTIPRGNAGVDGTNGVDGWTPIFAVVSDSARRVLQVADWTGGTGSKPTTGQYVGATGLTSTLANGIDIRGGTGSTGDTGPANTLTVGTVTTGAAGSSVVVTITGSAPAQTINLTIPKGDKGDAGTPIEVQGNDTDQQLEWRLVGAASWTPLVTYAAIQAASLHDYAPDIAAAKNAAIGAAFLFG